MNNEHIRTKPITLQEEEDRIQSSLADMRAFDRRYNRERRQQRLAKLAAFFILMAGFVAGWLYLLGLR